MVGYVCSFVNSLIASANGWRIPIIPTLLGPFRIWMYANTFRSSSVKKATPTNTQITKRMYLNVITNVITTFWVFYGSLNFVAGA